MAALLSSGPGGNRQTHAWKKRFTKHESIISEKTVHYNCLQPLELLMKAYYN